MKLLSHICHSSDVPKKVDWISNELGFHIFKIQKTFFANNFDSNYSAIIFIVNNDDEESYLKLKYPNGTFGDHGV